MELYNSTTFKISELITKSYSTSFYSAALLFPEEIRKSIFALYGFVRFADEIVDTFHKFDKENLLKGFEDDLVRDLENGISLNPVLNSFISIINKYNIEYELIAAFLKSMKMDLTISEYSTKSEIDDYIYGSAEVIGLICLKIFCNGSNKQYENLKYFAMKLGSAFQKVNFLRDLNQDFSNLKRTYFPIMKNVEFSEVIKNKIVEDIEKDFSEAILGIKKLPINSKTAVYVSFLYYKKLLEKIKKTSSEIILKKRIRIPNYIKFLVIIKGVISCKLNFIK